ncbi:MAG: Na+/H+ antiporter NhaA [Actinobacteria bacterium]|nr:Na+/H+ antiporter NhaA [Actinomycetota bacterium]
MLLGAAAAALVWSNSPWSNGYEQLWGTELVLRVGRWVMAGDLRRWVNDGLMSLFFLVVGLEIKREVLTGELRAWRAAALSAAAAVGGMLVPALVFLALNAGGSGARGWGIPMATDVAFALGVLTLATRAAPPSLKPFLLTLAIVDDIGAIVVIAIAYSKGVDPGALAAAALLLVSIVALQRINVRSSFVYVSLGLATWLAVRASGVHPAIAGAALGFVTPAVPFQRPRTVSEEAHRTADETLDEPFPPDADAHHWLRLAGLSREAVSPLARLEHALLPWTSFVVVPLFALANAGVGLSARALSDALHSRVTLGVVAGLVLGKLVGVVGASRLALRLGVARLPEGASSRDLVGVGAVAGVGFTVALFVTELAFPTGSPAEAAAKVGTLVGSFLAGAIGYAILRASRSRS